MFSLFNQPYPADHTFARELRKAVYVGLFVGLFLLTFQPFGLNLWETPNKSLKILGFGGLSFVITAFHYIVWPRLLPKLFAEEGWTVGREILFVTLNILLIAVANRLYLEALLRPEESSGLNWIGMILVTFLIGLFPVTGLVSLNYIRRLKQYSQTAAELPVHGIDSTNLRVEATSIQESNPSANSTLTLIAENEKDVLTFPAEALVFIESSDNYCTITYLKNNQPAKPLLRSSLSRLEKQIAQPHVVRCHRSYVVNLNRVERVTGNAQGYKLHLLDGQFQIPVARQYNDTLIAELRVL